MIKPEFLAKDLPELLRMRPEDFPDALNEAQIRGIFDQCGAIWVHNGDPLMPHAELTTGKCSNAFFDCLRVLRYIALNDVLARQLAAKIRKELERYGIADRQIDWVIGSPMAAIAYAQSVGRYLGAVSSLFVEKNPQPVKGEKFLWNRQQILENEVAMRVEELITTFDTTDEVEKAVHAGNPAFFKWLPIIGTMVFRPDKFPPGMIHGEYSIVSLIYEEVWSVPQSECHLCRKGSPRVRPKQNWKYLTTGDRSPF